MGNRTSFKIHLKVHGDGGRSSRLGHLGEALEGNALAVAGGVLANDGLKTIVATSKLALLYEQFTSATGGCREHRAHYIESGALSICHGTEDRRCELGTLQLLPNPSDSLLQK